MSKRIGVGGLLGIILAIVVIIIIEPFLLFWIGYFSGWLAKLVVGRKLALALNTLFNVSFFTPDKLPLIGGALGWLGSFFKNVTLSVKTNN